ncbi:hypothetical protein HaLaN_01951, partial [Haematococcus lacustris]
DVLGALRPSLQTIPDYSTALAAVADILTKEAASGVANALGNMNDDDEEEQRQGPRATSEPPDETDLDTGAAPGTSNDVTPHSSEDEREEGGPEVDEFERELRAALGGTEVVKHTMAIGQGSASGSLAASRSHAPAHAAGANGLDSEAMGADAGAEEVMVFKMLIKRSGKDDKKEVQ